MSIRILVLFVFLFTFSTQADVLRGWPIAGGGAGHKGFCDQPVFWGCSCNHPFGVPKMDGGCGYPTPSDITDCHNNDGDMYVWHENEEESGELYDCQITLHENLSY